MREYIWLACSGIALGRLGSPTMVTPSSVTVSPGRVSSQFPPASAARSTITEPGRIPRAASAVMSTGAGRPGMSAVVMTASDSATWRRDQLLLALVLVLRERDRVATLAFGALDVELEEGGAEALDLLLHGGTHVEGGDDGSEPPRGGDRLQAGDSRAEHEDARGRDRARGGRQHRQELRQVVGRDQRGLVAGDRALRGERVHRLRSGDARDRVHRERRHAPLGEGAHEVAVDEWLQERDEDLPVAELRHLFAGGLLHLRNDVDSRERVAHDLRAGLLVRGVEESGFRHPLPTRPEPRRLLPRDAWSNRARGRLAARPKRSPWGRRPSCRAKCSAHRTV